MRILYIISVCFCLAAICMWAGSFKFVKRKYAFIAAVLLVLASGVMMAAAVLPQNSFYGKTVTKAVTQEKVIALTFDDGPYQPYTDELLDMLDAKQVKATFFIVGDNAAHDPETVQNISAKGHEIALHAGVHTDFLKLNREELIKNIADGRAVVENLTGKKIMYIRPPHGFRDWCVFDAAEENGLTVVNWSVIPRDWTNPGADVIADRVCQDAFPGAIVLLHDGDSPKKLASRAQTVEATGKVIDRLRQQGYRFVTVSELLTYEE